MIKLHKEKVELSSRVAHILGFPKQVTQLKEDVHKNKAKSNEVVAEHLKFVSNIKEGTVKA